MIDNLPKNMFLSIKNRAIPLIIIPGTLIVLLLGSACRSFSQGAGSKSPDARSSTPTPSRPVVSSENRDQHTATVAPVSASPTATSRPTSTPGQPDLVVREVSVGRVRIQKEDQPYTKLFATVKNVGSAAVPKKTFHMRLYLNGEPQSAGVRSLQARQSPGKLSWALAHPGSWVDTGHLSKLMMATASPRRMKRITARIRFPLRSINLIPRI